MGDLYARVKSVDGKRVVVIDLDDFRALLDDIDWGWCEWCDMLVPMAECRVAQEEDGSAIVLCEECFDEAVEESKEE